MSSHTTTAQRASRLSIRASASDKTLLTQAARARRMNMSQFVLEASLDAARTIIADQTEFRLPPKEWEAFCQRLEEAPQVIPALRRLFSEADPFHG